MRSIRHNNNGSWSIMDMNTEVGRFYMGQLVEIEEFQGDYHVGMISECNIFSNMRNLTIRLPDDLDVNISIDIEDIKSIQPTLNKHVLMCLKNNKRV